MFVRGGTQNYISETGRYRWMKIFFDNELQVFSASVQEKDREEAAEYVDTFWKQQTMAEIEAEESEQMSEWLSNHRYHDENDCATGKIGKVVAGVFLALVALVAFLWYLQ